MASRRAAAGRSASGDPLRDRLGNRALVSLLRSRGDRHEREADAFASRPSASLASIDDPERAGAAKTLAASLGEGQPLAPPIRARYESDAGADLSAVRVHTDGAAGRQADALGAHALTVGNDIVFGPGQFAPDSARGAELLGHEIAHTRQQGGKPRAIQAQLNASVSPPTFGAAADLEPSVILRGPRITGEGQMLEWEFLGALADRLDAIEVQRTQASGVERRPLGSIIVPLLESIEASSGRSLESIVSEIAGVSAATAEGYLDRLVVRIPQLLQTTEDANAAALESMQPDAQTMSDALGVTTPADVSEGPAAPAPAGPAPTPEQLHQQFPEVTPTIAGILGPSLPSIWGPLSAMLQGTIFHSIISAGYVAGAPAPPHPLALINRGGGVLGRNRTDIRNPATFSVMEIKPEGDPGGVAQLAGYVATLQADNPAWHQATGAEPGENWAPASAPAVYSLSLFGITFDLVAYNNYAAEPGMIYYRLDVRGKLVPVYVPQWKKVKNRKYNFQFPFEPLPVPNTQPVSTSEPTTDDGGGIQLPPPEVMVPAVAGTGIVAGVITFLADGGWALIFAL